MSYALPPNLHLLGPDGVELLLQLQSALAAHNRAQEQVADSNALIRRLVLRGQVMAARAEAERRQGMH